ncbi:hypothetical protein THIOM_005091 [Candidatus Thiomargarita nelsonii]|uniref:Uncharacterized protein n=1 Tax=Candidatus Thiomargarita nelsonii TaxID=1003181 RepID=A0A176RU71_9GAMM|nr:hypothetical protein THIOM_005091 [Candidatus Thiomargarita nelsonii]
MCIRFALSSRSSVPVIRFITEESKIAKQSKIAVFPTPLMPTKTVVRGENAKSSCLMPRKAFICNELTFMLVDMVF